MDEEIIHVLMLNESAIQNPTKFHGPHWRRSGSTGLRSWFVSYGEAPVTVSPALCHIGRVARPGGEHEWAESQLGKGERDEGRNARGGIMAVIAKQTTSRGYIKSTEITKKNIKIPSIGL